MSEDLLSGIDERLWTEKEVAHPLHASVYTMWVWVWRRQKKATFCKLPNGMTRYRQQDLEELLNNGFCLSSSEVVNHIPKTGAGEKP